MRSGGNIPQELREQLESVWRAAVAAVEPGAAVARALADKAPPRDAVHLLALGKAAIPMAQAAVAWLAEHGRRPAGGLVVTAEVPHPTEALQPLAVVVGDHPVPRVASRDAAAAVANAVDSMGPADAVVVLLSGGTSSLVAAPAAGVSGADLARLWELLLASGLDIHQTNAVRRRFTRWGGGRLARALAGRPTKVLAISDVPGDVVASIGSGPCAADPMTAADVERLLVDAGLLDVLPGSLTALLRDPSALGTIAAGDPVFTTVETHIVASNDDAVAAAVAHARALGWDVALPPVHLAGEAAAAGRELAERLAGATAQSDQPFCLVAGGETTVATGVGAPPGGRCQELALAAAEVLARVGAGGGVVLFAAGTDGRDGPTDAAGAVVDGDTWGRIGGAGRDPAADLARHASHAALAAAGALIRTGPTGTNVMDVVLGARRS